ncbi:hypothetical protein GCM10020331_072060 [Ectobacillus funiculus]
MDIEEQVYFFYKPSIKSVTAFFLLMIKEKLAPCPLSGDKGVVALILSSDYVEFAPSWRFIRS